LNYPLKFQLVSQDLTRYQFNLLNLKKAVGRVGFLDPTFLELYRGGKKIKAACVIFILFI